MNELNKNLSEVFDVEPVKEIKKEKLPVVQQNYIDPDMKQDLTDAYQQSKENLRSEESTRLNSSHSDRSRMPSSA